MVAAQEEEERASNPILQKTTQKKQHKEENDNNNNNNNNQEKNTKIEKEKKTLVDIKELLKTLDTMEKETEEQEGEPKKKPEIKLIRFESNTLEDQEEMIGKLKEIVNNNKEQRNEEEKDIKMIKINMDDVNEETLKNLDWEAIAKQMMATPHAATLKNEEGEEGGDGMKKITEWILKTIGGEEGNTEKIKAHVKRDMGKSIKKLAEAFETHKEKGISSSPATQFQLKRFTEKHYFEEMMKQEKEQKEQKENMEEEDAILMAIDEKGNVMETKETEIENVQEKEKEETNKETKEETKEETNKEETNKEETNKEEHGLDNVLDRLQLEEGQHQLLKIKEKYGAENATANVFELEKAYLSHANTYHDDQGIAWYNIATLYGSSKYKNKNMTKYKNFVLLASTRGNARAQFELAHLYENELISREDHLRINKLLGSNVLSEEPIDSKAMAFLNYYFAALAGHVKAQMVMGHRHFYGFQVKKHCAAAQVWYHMAATSVFNHMMKNHIFQLKDEKYKVWDEEHYESKHYSNAMEYVKYHASKGDVHSQMVYGYAQMFGMHGVEQNPHRAAEQFQRALDAGAVEAYGPLGQLYVTGIGGFPQDNETALAYFQKGAEEHDAVSLAGLGMMFLRGRGIEKDLSSAFTYLNMSAHLGNPQAQYNLGLLYLRGEGVTQSYKMAHEFFKLSAIQGTLPAQYQLGLLHMNGFGVSTNCPVAVKYFKHVSERGRELESMNRAFHHYRQGNLDDALFLYSQLAETGDEVALHSVAYMYDHHLGATPFYELSRELASSNQNESLPYYADRQALKWHELSAKHLSDHEAHIRVGDFYYYGKGTTQNYHMAIRHYRRASSYRFARASYNLGYMHEHGLGLPQDFYLAKRFYDEAATQHPLAFLPVYMTLSKMYLHWGYVILMKHWLPYRDSLNTLLSDLSLFSADDTDSSTSTPIDTPSPPPEFDSLVDAFWYYLRKYELLLFLANVSLFIALLILRPFIFRNHLNRQDRRRQRRRQRQPHH